MCEKCNGVSLHTHDESSLDGICTTAEMIDRAIELGQSAIGFANHYECSSIVEATTYAETLKKEKNIDFKVIAGVEAYIDVNEDFNNINRTHLTILGDGLTGYNNIVKIQKEASYRTVNNSTNKLHYKRPAGYLKDVLENSEGLIVLSGCPSSAFNDMSKFTEQDADGFYKEFSEKLGDKFYAEFTLSSEDVKGYTIEDRARWVIHFADKYNLGIAVTDDAHFTKPQLAPAHDFYTKKVAGFDYNNKDLYMKSAVEQIAFINNLKLTDKEKQRLIQGVYEQELIASRLSSVKFNTGLIMPEIVNGKQIFLDRVYAEYHRHLTLEKAGDEYKEVSKARLEEELRVIGIMGFENYFLKVARMNDFVLSIGGKLPYGRGSAGGSYVCFLLGIVKLNPLKYGLLFERMLNIQRQDPIDIDADYSKEHREALIEHMEKTEGAVGIVTHQRYGHNGLIDDMGSFYNWTSGEIKALKVDEANFKNTKVWKELLKQTPKIDVIYDNLYKKIRNPSRHAGGLVIEPKKSDYQMPVTVTKDGKILCSLIEGGHGHMASKIGLNKHDLLGNDGLTFVDKLEKATGVEAPVFGLDEYHEGFKYLETGKTDGIFQFSGTATSDYGKQHGVKNFRDIISITSLARKGVVLAGTDQEILKHRPVQGLPKRRSNGVFDNGTLVELTLENGKSFKIYDNWQVKTTKGEWVKVKDLTEQHELEIE